MYVRSGHTPNTIFQMTKLPKFYLRLLHPKAIAEKADEHFFIGVFTDFSNLNFGRIRQKVVILIFCSTEGFRLVVFS
jgi:hypothetical protein